MTEAPVAKPEGKYINHQNKIARPISTGYELKQDIDPEIKRNLPSELHENKQLKLNINAPSFVPKVKPEKKPEYSGSTFKPNYNSQYANNMNNMYNMKIMNSMNNNNNYYGRQPYYANNTYQAQQFQIQPNFYPKNYMNNIPNTQNNNNNQFYNMSSLGYNVNQNSQPIPLSNSYNNQMHTKQDNKSSIPLKPTQKTFIPKSMRENKRKPTDDGSISLNKDAPEYIPQNETLKKREEEIKKQKEKEENIKNEEKKEEQKSTKETEKEEEIKEEKRNLTNDENSNEQKKKSKLAALLESNDNDVKKPTKEKTKQIGNEKNENTQTNKNKKNPKAFLSQKINEINTKVKKNREEEERQKEEERKRKEEEKKRKEEEKMRKEEEEEQKRKEEEEKRKQMELEEQKRKEEDEKNKVIERKYFIVFKNRKSEKKEYKYTFEYIMQFKNWKISKEDELLTPSVKQHFKNFEDEEREGGKRKKNDGKSNKNRISPKEYSQQPKTELTNSEEPANSMEKWARKDMTKEIKAAEEYKQKLEETIKDDPIKRNLRGYLNMLTKDNYEQIKQDILGVIKDNVDYQIKFLDVLFQKAVLERAYVALYAKLCKELDKELPQKNIPKEPKEPKEGDKKPKPTSIMRAKLLDKCKEIFQIKNNETFDEYIKEKDPQEREYKLKKFVLGNVYFITELIKIKILSKKIAPVCIKYLFERYKSSKSDQKLKLINLQAIVIFTDQFGSLVHSQEKKIELKDAKSFKDSIDKIFQQL